MSTQRHKNTEIRKHIRVSRQKTRLIGGLATAWLFSGLLGNLAQAEGLDKLTGYNWHQAAFSHCPGKEYPPECHALSTRWDAGKKQFIDYGYRYYPEDQTLAIGLSMYNDDRTDGDTVCFVSLWIGADGQIAHGLFQRWGVKAVLNNDGFRRTEHWRYQLADGLADKIAAVRIGWKECDKVDDLAVANKVIDLAAVACSAYTAQPEACAATALAVKSQIAPE